jgi:hypothetical protein
MNIIDSLESAGGGKAVDNSVAGIYGVRSKGGVQSRPSVIDHPAFAIETAGERVPAHPCTELVGTYCDAHAGGGIYPGDVGAIRDSGSSGRL